MTSKGSQTEKKGPVEYGKGTGPTYNTYLKVAELKQLQVCLSKPAHHDEPLFIIIHQAYELWFKLILHELDIVVELLARDDARRSTFYMRRVIAIMRLLVGQIHILETMSPKDFLGFRSNLNPASGFQSSQFREIEFVCGLKDERMLIHFQKEPASYDELLVRYRAPSLQDAFYSLLERHGFVLPFIDQDDLQGTPEEQETKSERLQDTRVMELKRLYDGGEKYADQIELAETLIELDELLSLWRTHHVTVVERMIGFKRGTGGSEGVGYLRQTLMKRAFPDLWKVRTVLEM